MRRLLDEHYVIVAGARRLRAAMAAGLAKIPAVVRDFTDLEVFEAQVIENLHHSDLHPMEEGESDQGLHDRHDCKVEQIAAKLGKSKTYVYDRMNLCGLIDPAREAFL